MLKLMESGDDIMMAWKDEKNLDEYYWKLTSNFMVDLICAALSRCRQVWVSPDVKFLAVWNISVGRKDAHLILTVKPWQENSELVMETNLFFGFYT